MLLAVAADRLVPPVSSSENAIDTGASGTGREGPRAMSTSITPPIVLGPCRTDEEPLTTLILWAPVMGTIDMSLRWSQPMVIGIPSRNIPICRSSEPLSDGWDSPRLFFRTTIRGIARSTSSIDGAGRAPKESSSRTTALAPPVVSTGRATRTVIPARSYPVETIAESTWIVSRTFWADPAKGGQTQMDRTSIRQIRMNAGSEG